MVRMHGEKSDEEFLIIGGGFGHGSAEAATQIMEYSTGTRSWEEWGRLIQGRFFHGCAFVNGKVIVAGGLNSIYFPDCRYHGNRRCENRNCW